MSLVQFVPVTLDVICRPLCLAIFTSTGAVWGLAAPLCWPPAPSIASIGSDNARQLAGVGLLGLDIHVAQYLDALRLR